MAIEISVQDALDKALREVGRLTLENVILHEELDRRPPASAFERVQEIFGEELHATDLSQSATSVMPQRYADNVEGPDT